MGSTKWDDDTIEKIEILGAAGGLALLSFAILSRIQTFIPGYLPVTLELMNLSLERQKADDQAALDRATVTKKQQAILNEFYKKIATEGPITVETKGQTPDPTGETQWYNEVKQIG